MHDGNFYAILVDWRDEHLIELSLVSVFFDWIIPFEYDLMCVFLLVFMEKRKEKK